MSCPFYLTQGGDFVLELHRFPTLCSVGRIRIGISVDNGEMNVFESQSTDEHRANWKHNILNNVDKLTGCFTGLAAGLHSLTFTAIDPYVSFTRAVLYDEKSEAGKQLSCQLTSPAKLVMELIKEAILELSCQIQNAKRFLKILILMHIVSTGTAM